MKTLATTIVRTRTIILPHRHKTQKTIGEVLHVLKLDTLGDKSSDLSEKHDRILYK